MELTVEPISICVDESFDANNSRCSAIKIQVGTAYEVNMIVPINELSLLPKVKDARWDERGSLAIGTSAGEKAFWCSDDDGLSILIGHDDETWDISLRLPMSILDEIIREAEAFQD